jgi:predicted molibdopterin-dependent oxidoreductase YjgC
VLPALSWAEHDGTFTNLERRVQRAPKAINNPQTKAAPDWMILDHLSTRMGTNWPYTDVRGITAEITEAVPIYSGPTCAALGDQGLQWDGARLRTESSYQKADQAEQPAVPEGSYALVSGRVLYDGGNMFRRTQRMQSMAFDRSIGINPADAATVGLQDGTMVTVTSNHGQLQLFVKLLAQVQPGTVWIPESLADAPVATLLGEESAEVVQIEFQPVPVIA